MVNCQAWSQVQHVATLLQSNLFRMHRGMSEVSVADWEQDGQTRSIALDPLVEPHEQIAKRFRQSKKLRLGCPHAERLLDEAEQAISPLHGHLEALLAFTAIEALKAYCLIHQIPWEKRALPTVLFKKEPPKPYRVYHSKCDVEIWVGKSAKDNDRMTFQHANGSDWWLHAKDYPGSHVIVRIRKGGEPDENTLQEAAKLALLFSKSKDKVQGEVSLTQVKWLKRIKGAPGKVLLSKHRVLYVR